jgi:hypothetical protein
VTRVRKIVEMAVPSMCARTDSKETRSGFDTSLLGGVTDHYVPDLILQGEIYTYILLTFRVVSG